MHLLFLIQTNQCNTDKQKSKKKIGDDENKIPGISGLVVSAALESGTGEVENKITDISGLATAVVFNTKIQNEVYNEIPDVSD